MGKIEINWERTNRMLKLSKRREGDNWLYDALITNITKHTEREIEDAKTEIFLNGYESKVSEFNLYIYKYVPVKKRKRNATKRPNKIFDGETGRVLS